MTDIITRKIATQTSMRLVLLTFFGVLNFSMHAFAFSLNKGLPVTGRSYETSETGTSGPQLIATNLENAIDGFAGKTVILTFDQPVFSGIGSIQVFRETDDQAMFHAGVRSGRVIYQGNTVSFDMLNTLKENTSYYIRIGYGTIQGSNGNSYSGVFDKETLAFTTISWPKLVSSNPEKGGVEFESAVITLTFSTDVFKGTGTISVVDRRRGQIATSVDVGSSSVSINGKTVSIDLGSSLPLQKRYYLSIPKTAFKDSFEQFYQGVKYGSQFAFDTIKIPRLVSSTPEPGATQFGGNTIRLTFDRPVFKGIGRFAVIDAETDMEITGAGVNSNRVSFGGSNVVTFNLLKPLPEGRRVYLRIPAQSILDEFGNRFQGYDKRKRFDLTTITSPALIDQQLSDPEEANPVITLTFDQEVARGVGRINIFTTGNETPIDGAGVANSRVIFDGNKVTFNLRNPVPDNTSIYMRVPASAIQNSVGAYYEGALDQSTIVFSTRVTPALLSSNPGNGAIEFPGDRITLTFDRDMYKGSGTIGLYDVGNDQAIFEVDLNADNVNISGREVTIIFPVSLRFNQHLYLKIPETAFKDIAGNFFPGITDKTGFTFTTPYLFTLAETSPARDQVGFNDEVITLNFSNSVVTRTGRIKIINRDTGEEAAAAGVGSSRVTVTGHTVTFDMGRRLPFGYRYQLRIVEGSFEDPQGNAFAGLDHQDNFHFTTLTTPVVTDTEIVNDLQEPGGNYIKLTFDREVFPGTGRLSLINEGDDSEVFGAGVGSSRVDFSGNEVTLNLPASLPADLFLYLQVPASAIRDADDVPYDGALDEVTLPFSTYQFPQLRGSAPSDDGLLIGTTISLKFDRDVFPGTGEISLIDAQDDSPILTADPGGSMVSFEKNEVTFTIGDQAFEKQFYLRVTHGAIRDENGNDFDGIHDKTSLNFSTPSLPFIASTVPQNNAVDVVDATIKISFDQPILKGFGLFKVFRVLDDTEVVSFSMQNPRITVEGNVATINLLNYLEAGVAVYVVIADTNFRGLYYNFFPGIDQNVDFNFTPLAALTIESSNPVDDQMDFSGTNIELTFNREIQNGSGRLSVLKTSDNTEVTGAGVGSGRVTIEGSKLTLDLINPLPAGESYYLRVPGSAIEDMLGRTFEGILDNTTLNFSTDAVAGKRAGFDASPEFLNGRNNTEIRVYPNPVSNQLFIELGQTKKTVRLQIIDVSGKERYVNEVVESAMILDVTAYAAGMYVAIITTNEGVVVRKKFTISR